tara:strand:- start:120 stop:857 length:738 start_codon:yes stop_codon:yes gene_type:complete
MVMRRLVVLQHVGIEGPGLFSKIAKERGFEVEIIHSSFEYNLPNLNNGDILLILGGPMGVKEIGSSKYPWLKKEVKYLKSILKKDIGIIGVCLGAQLLAYAAGGDVEILKTGSPLKPTPEIGWSEISSLDYKSDDEMSLILKKPMKVLHWHSDRILLPKNIEILASSKKCKEQLFKIRDKAYGLQFHVETEVSMVYDWIKTYEDFIIASLGKNGPNLLKENEKRMENETRYSRVSFINKLIELII